MKQKLKTIFELIRDTAQSYSQNKGSMLAASLAYYTMFSLAPLIVLIVALSSMFFGDEAVQGRLVYQIDEAVGRDAAIVIQNIIENASTTSSSVTATIISTILLLVGASGAFSQLKRAINSMWRIAQPPNKGVLVMIKTRALAFIMVIGVGILLILSLSISTISSVFSDWTAEMVPQLAGIFPLLNFVVSFIVLASSFALIFKFVPDAAVAWQDVGLGAVVTAVLFSMGQYLIGWYLANWKGGAAYGAASSIILLLFWLYLSAQILLFGAAFTQVYANSHGSPLRFAEGILQIMHQRYEPPHPAPLVIEESQTAAPPPLPPPRPQRQKQVAVGLLGLAFGLLLGFIGSLRRS